MEKNLSFFGKQIASIALALTVVSGSTATSTAQSNGVPVKVGGEADYDACGSTGKVVGLNSAGDNFLAVRQGPGGKHKMIDKLHSGNHVYMCNEQGNWIGIVYDSSKDQDCGVSSPIPKKQSYSGTCNSGWVHKRFITVTAG